MFGKKLTGKAKCVNNTASFEANHYYFWVNIYADWDNTGIKCR